ncbi:MAG: tripartite tricarboxylate transporter permease [Sphaerochaetaceae bacterium]|nr:tripartite tricarboxylate transporter permease [Sphaerochaetaceae bacterium]
MELLQFVFENLFDPFSLLLIFGGTVLGVIFGSIPGLNGALAIILLLPFTFMLEAELGIVLLVSIYVGGISGGFISAALIGIPGAPAAIATTIEAWPLTQKGGAVKALGVGTIATFIGTFFSCIIAMFLSPIIATYAVKLGPWEFFGLCLTAVSLVISLSKADVLKGIASACIGFIIGSIGFAPIDGARRFTFGISQLNTGLALGSTMMGFFVLSSVLIDYGKGNMTLPSVAKQSIKGWGFTLREFKDNVWNIIRSFFIGLGIGFLPGMGSGISAFVSYAKAKDSSKHPEEFGNGAIEGIFATETANNSTIGGAVVPMIALGIPGDTTTAILLGALTIQGLEPGPLLMVNDPGFVYVLFGGLILASIVTLGIQYFGMRLFPKILSIKFMFLFPVIMVFGFNGAFAQGNSIFNVYMVVVCGAIGFLLSVGRFPITPLILAYILAPLLETYLRRGISYTEQGALTFFTRPISLALIIIATFSIIRGLLKKT